MIFYFVFRICDNSISITRLIMAKYEPFVQRINAELKAIIDISEDSIKNNTSTYTIQIDNLQKHLDESKYEISNLRGVIAQKDAEIANLKNRLIECNKQLGSTQTQMFQCLSKKGMSGGEPMKTISQPTQQSLIKSMTETTDTGDDTKFLSSFLGRQKIRRH